MTMNCYLKVLLNVVEKRGVILELKGNKRSVRSLVGSDTYTDSRVRIKKQVRVYLGKTNLKTEVYKNKV